MFLLVVGLLVVVVVAACYCICLLFILSLLLAISFKWCQSFFTCFAQVRWDYPALCVCKFIIVISFNRQIGSDFEFITVGGHYCPALLAFALSFPGGESNRIK